MVQILPGEDDDVIDLLAMLVLAAGGIYVAHQAAHLVFGAGIDAISSVGALMALISIAGVYVSAKLGADWFTPDFDD